MKTFNFQVTLVGTGEDVEAAWLDAVIGFAEDPGTLPDKSDITEIETEDEE